MATIPPREITIDRAWPRSCAPANGIHDDAATEKQTIMLKYFGIRIFLPRFLTRFQSHCEVRHSIAAGVSSQALGTGSVFDDRTYRDLGRHSLSANRTAMGREERQAGACSSSLTRLTRLNPASHASEV